MKKIVLTFSLSFLLAFVILTPAHFLEDKLHAQGFPLHQLEGGIYTGSGILGTEKFNWALNILSMLQLSPQWQLKLPEINTQITVSTTLLLNEITHLKSEGSIEALSFLLSLPKGIQGHHTLWLEAANLNHCTDKSELTLEVVNIKSREPDLNWGNISFTSECRNNHWLLTPTIGAGDIQLSGNVTINELGKVNSKLVFSAKNKEKLKQLEQALDKKAKRGKIKLQSGN